MWCLRVTIEQRWSGIERLTPETTAPSTEGETGYSEVLFTQIGSCHYSLPSIMKAPFCPSVTGRLSATIVHCICQITTAMIGVHSPHQRVLCTAQTSPPFTARITRHFHPTVEACVCSSHYGGNETNTYFIMMASLQLQRPARDKKP